MTTYGFNIQGYNALASGSYQFDIQALNKICTDQGGTSGHSFVIAALNEIAGTVGQATDASFNITALNRICIGCGGIGGHMFEIDAINELVTLWPPLATAYIATVAAGSGIVLSEATVRAIYLFLQQNALYTPTQLLFDANAGLVQRVDGVLKYIRTAFDLSANANNLDGSATATVQPRLVGGIAPGSKYAASNQNGEARYFTHTPISFAADQAWSICFVINNNSNSEDTSGAIIGYPTDGHHLYLKTGGVNRFRFYNGSEAVFTADSTYLGKNTIFNLVANGLGNLSLFKNGSLYQTLSKTTNFTTSTFLSSFTGSRYYNGKGYYYRIQSGAMTATQVASEAAFLRTLYPEIESVVIGTQEWATRNFEAVCTPQGNVIAEMQAATAVAKQTNGTFDANVTGWSMLAGSSIAWNAGQYAECVRTGVLGSIIISQVCQTVGKWYKISFKAKSATYTGKAGINSVYYTTPYNSVQPNMTSSFQTYEAYGKAKLTTGAIYLSLIPGDVATGTQIDVDDVVISELGWANATEIYDAVYAATAGTADQKHYAACKEAGFWCYYNNDAANGAIYGKLYNWYAASLLDLDMASASFGWRVPTSTQFTTLQTYLGGASVAGGKMKMTGTDYWTTPNTGADNSSGFTGLGGGVRIDSTGTFAVLKSFCTIHSITESGGNVVTYSLSSADNTFSASDQNKKRGASIRLIKS